MRVPRWSLLLVPALAACGAAAEPSADPALPAVAEAQPPEPKAPPRRTGRRDPVVFTCAVSAVTDGDSFRCAETEPDGRQIRVRLSGVAARERDGSCAPGHPCPDASAEAATAALSRLAAHRTLTCEQDGTTYRRRAAFCRRDDGVDLSCAMVSTGTVARWDRYWRGHSCEGAATA